MDNKMRFSGKVDNYVKYRPAYPREFIDHLTKTVGISMDSVIADVGSRYGYFYKAISGQGETLSMQLSQTRKCGLPV